MSEWGGRRKGAGRPKGTTKNESNQRPLHGIRAFDDEWELIDAFAKIVKQGNKEACEEFLAKQVTTK